MSKVRLENVFQRCREQKRAALVGYLTAGDPDQERSEQYINTLTAHTDIIEIGMPFSDPMADGPVIQAASERALAAGCTLKDVFSIARSVREAYPEKGIVLMGYANTPYSIGFDVFAERAADAGVDGVLLVDLPPEESDLCRSALQSHDIAQIFLLAPTSSAARIAKVLQYAEGFIYYVSLTGITGAAIGALADIQQRVDGLRQQAAVPVCVGFGIKTAEQAAAVATFADGVVVGSAFVSKVTDANRNFSDSVASMKSLVESLEIAMKRKES